MNAVNTAPDHSQWLRDQQQRFCERSVLPALARAHALRPVAAATSGDPFYSTELPQHIASALATLVASPTDPIATFSNHASAIASFGIYGSAASALAQALCPGYLTLASSIIAYLQQHDEPLPPGMLADTEARFHNLSQLLAAAAPESQTQAKVLQVERRCRNISVIRLEASTPLPYLPGQYVPIRAALLRGHQRFLFPTIPSNDAGQVEFHVGRPSPLVLSKPGDTWNIGAGRGGFRSELEAPSPTGASTLPDTLLFGHGLGYAAIRCVILGNLLRGDPPRTHLVVSADYPGELYDLAGLWQLSSASPWLTVTPCTTHKHDAWDVGATDHSRPPRGLHLTQHGQAGEIMAAFGAWADRRILIAGPESSCAATAAALRAAGTPPEHIDTQDFTFRPFWQPLLPAIFASSP